jgi:xanthine dehydrogenase accessory factor
VKRDLLGLAGRLHRNHQPFVLATVVWARGPSSGKQGGTALIEADGTVHGWIGGACAEPVVLRYARRVVNDGEPQLLYLGPAEELDGHTRDGVLTVPIACDSDGALEVFMEPVLPQPRIVVIGRSPAVHSLAALLGAMDWRATVVDDGGDHEDYPDEAEVYTSLTDLAGIEVDQATPIVVATQGHYDEAALEAALATPAGYIGLVASAKRAETVLGYLRDRGVSEAEVARIRSPAGLDLGPIEHREIAVSILAELVRLRAAGELAVTAEAETEPAPDATAIDPVCGMTVDVAGARFTADYEGETYFFCAAGCEAAFSANPESFTASSSGLPIVG